MSIISRIGNTMRIIFFSILPYCFYKMYEYLSVILKKKKKIIIMVIYYLTNVSSLQKPGLFFFCCVLKQTTESQIVHIYSWMKQKNKKGDKENLAKT